MRAHRKKVGVAFATVLAIGFMAISLASAKGRFSTVVIMALGTGELRIVSDPDLEGFTALADFTNGSKDATNPGSAYADSYEVTRIGEGEEGRLFAIDRLRYVPPGSKEHGYILYEGLINGSSEYDGKWFPTTLAGDEVMKRILSSSPSAPLGAIHPAAAGALALVVLTAGFTAGIMYQRRRSGRVQAAAQSIEKSAHRAA